MKNTAALAFAAAAALGLTAAFALGSSGDTIYRAHATNDDAAKVKVVVDKEHGEKVVRRVVTRKIPWSSSSQNCFSSGRFGSRRISGHFAIKQGRFKAVGVNGSGAEGPGGEAEMDVKGKIISSTDAKGHAQLTFGETGCNSLDVKWTTK